MTGGRQRAKSLAIALRESGVTSAHRSSKEVGHGSGEATRGEAARGEAARGEAAGTPAKGRGPGWEVNPVYCVGDGGGISAGTGRRRAPALSQTLGPRTALDRRTLWPAGLWSGWTQPADAGERSSEVTRTTREAGVREGGAHQAWSSGPRWTRRSRVGWDGAARHGRHAGVGSLEEVDTTNQTHKRQRQKNCWLATIYLDFGARDEW